MPTLLFEIGCEELPASACREAAAQLPELCLEHLGAKPAQLYIGPRRLAMVVEDVSGEAAPEWVKGPPLALRDKAAAGFAKRYGVTPDELEERDGFLGVEVPGKPLAERLAAVLDALAFSKSMQWETDGLRFARPVRWLCARLDEAVVLGDGTSYGHRFTSGRIEIPSAHAYAETLRAQGVEPDAAERRRQIVEALPEGWRDPLAKLEEVVYLVESVAVLEGRFDERFLALPPRVIETAMQSHQRYFPLAGARFAFVANGGDPALGDPRQRARARGTARRRDLYLRARPGCRDRGARGPAWLDHVLPRRRLVRRQDPAARRARRAARRRRRREGGSAAREGRSGLGARARVSGSPGSHRRRVRARSRRFGRGLHGDRRALPPRRRRRAAALDRGGAHPLGRRQDRQPRRGIRRGAEAERLARPVRSPSRRNRPVPARRRGWAHARARRRREGVRRGAPRGPARSPGRARPCGTSLGAP